MCGLIAVADDTASLTRRSLAPALNRMRRRGPDQQGEWLSVDQRVRLGHCRLSIVDLSDAGRQPMFNEDRTIALVCNGEIYNYPSLRNRLEGLGHTFRSRSDSEVILHAFEEWGTDCVERLIGMFAFVLWDSGRRQLFAARDHLGIKPLYYAPFPQGVALASNLDALRDQVGIEPEPEPLAAAYALAMRYVPAPLAMWKGCAKLEAGHRLVWSRKAGLQISRYWEPPTEIDFASEHSDEGWNELFHEVLTDHLLADVPIGIFLSGGLDSTTLAGGLRQIGYSAAAIAASLPEFSGNEYPAAAETARRLGFGCQQVEVVSSDLARHETDLLQAFDEPEVDSGPLPMFSICRHAQQDFKVVFGGDGGDECFAGYPWYHPKPASNVFSRTTRDFRRTLRRALWQTGLRRCDPLLPAVIDRSNPFSATEIATLLADTGLEFSDDVRVAPFRKHFHEKLPRLRAMQRMDLMTFCSDLCLLKVDRTSMFHSLEVRVPLLDRRVVEWALSSPVRPEEHQADRSKPLLRRYVARARLGHVLKQPKSGFGMKGSELKTVSQTTMREIDESWMVRSGLLCDRWRNVVVGENGIDSRKLWLLKQFADWISYRVEGGRPEASSRPTATDSGAEAA